MQPTSQIKPIFFPILDNGAGHIRKRYLFSVLNSFGTQPIRAADIGDSHAGRARNRAAADFLLALDCDYLLFVDTDIQFNAQHIAWLMESRNPIQAGIYPKKQSPGFHPCLATFPQTRELTPHVNVAVARTGTGFLRVHRSVFESLKEQNGGPAEHYTNHGRDEWDFFKSGVANREWLSEDWFFCEMARSLGIPTMVDPRIQVQHEGSVLFPQEAPQLELIAAARVAGGRPGATVEDVLRALTGKTEPAPSTVSDSVIAERQEPALAA